MEIYKCNNKIWIGYIIEEKPVYSQLVMSFISERLGWKQNEGWQKPIPNTKLEEVELPEGVELPEKVFWVNPEGKWFTSYIPPKGETWTVVDQISEKERFKSKTNLPPGAEECEPKRFTCSNCGCSPAIFAFMLKCECGCCRTSFRKKGRMMEYFPGNPGTKNIFVETN